MHVFADVASDLIFKNYGLPKDEARKKYFETSGLPFCQQLEIIFPGSELNAIVAPVYEEQKLIATEDVVMDKETKNALVMLKESGYDLAISSNNFQQNIDNFIINNKLRKLFAAALGFKENFGKGEKHFDYIMHKLGVEKRGMVFVGDSLNDGRLAESNGIDFIAKLGTFAKKDFLKINKNINFVSNISDLIYGR